MGSARLQQLAAERRRKRIKHARVSDREIAGRLLASLHPKQFDAVNDTTRQVACLCSRRSGKSHAWLRQMLATALLNPGSHQLYVNATRKEAKKIAWRGAENRDGLVPLCEKYGIGHDANKSDLIITMDNGSIIELLGADGEKGIDRALGGSYLRVWIDEAQKFRDLTYAIRKVFGPATSDRQGQIVLTGTPSRSLATLFYDITNPDISERKKGWSVHEWDFTDNPCHGATQEEREAKLEQERIALGYAEDDYDWQREYKRKWIKEDAAYVYHVHRADPEQLFWGEEHPPPSEEPYIPPRWFVEKLLGIKKSWLYVVGADFGFDPDPFAYTILAFSYQDPFLYEVASWSKTQLINDRIAEILTEINQEYNPIAITADEGGHAVKSATRGWQKGWGERKAIPIIPATKQNKNSSIEWVNSDIRSGRMRLRKNSPLHKEMSKLQWVVNEVGERIKEDKRTGNHNCDANLYASRHVRHYLGVEPDDVEVGSDDWWRREEQALLDDACEA